MEDKEFNAGLELALSALAKGGLSRQALSGVLARHGVPDDVAGAVIEHLQKRRILNELASAADLADQARAKRFGRERAERQLADNGYADDVIAGTLADWTEETDRELAIQMLGETYPKGAPVSPALLRKAFGLLARRGFEEELARTVVYRYFGVDD